MTLTAKAGITQSALQRPSSIIIEDGPCNWLRKKNFYKFINEANAIPASTYKTADREKYLGYLFISYAAKDSLYSREKMNQINNYIFLVIHLRTMSAIVLYPSEHLRGQQGLYVNR